MHGEGASRLTSGASGIDELEDDADDFEPDPESDAAFFFFVPCPVVRVGGAESAVLGSGVFHQLLVAAFESGWM